MKDYFYFCGKLPYYNTSDIYKTTTLKKKILYSEQEQWKRYMPCKAHYRYENKHSE